MAYTTVTNNTIQGRNFHWLDNGGMPQATFIAGNTTVYLSSLTQTHTIIIGTATTQTFQTFKSPILSAADQATINENANLKTNWPLDFLLA